jgi:hypothetical protein
MVSKKRFETWLIAPKTSSERIVFSDRWKLILLVSALIALVSFRASAMPEFDENGKSCHVIELNGLSVQRLLDQGLHRSKLPVEISTAARISTSGRRLGTAWALSLRATSESRRIAYSSVDCPMFCTSEELV